MLSLSSTLTLRMIEVFASVQGETSYAGLPTTFIRLASCNLRCTWCDTTYSFGKGTVRSINEIIEEVENNGCPYVCVTGGEPLLQKEVHNLITVLCDRGFRLSLETGGSLPINTVDPRVKIILDLKCPGSGMSDKNEWSNIHFLKENDEVKFVLLDRADYDYAKMICDQYQLFGKVKEVLFSPVHGQIDPKNLVEWMLEDRLPIRLNLQIHKYVWDPQTKGV